MDDVKRVAIFRSTLDKGQGVWSLEGLCRCKFALYRVYLSKRCCGSAYDWFFPKKDRHVSILVKMDKIFDLAEAFVISRHITEVLYRSTKGDHIYITWLIFILANWIISCCVYLLFHVSQGHWFFSTSFFRQAQSSIVGRHFRVERESPGQRKPIWKPEVDWDLDAEYPLGSSRRIRISHNWVNPFSNALILTSMVLWQVSAASLIMFRLDATG